MNKILLTVGQIILTGCLSGSAYAYDFHDVKYIRAYDGDTITVTIPTVHPLFGNKISIRLEGIDTPEIRGQCQKEKDRAVAARDFVRQILSQSHSINIQDAERGKYFRIVGRVIADYQDISTLLLKNNLAVPYSGNTKTKNWCE